MKSLLQDWDECTLKNGKTPIVSGTLLLFPMDKTHLLLSCYSEDLKREVSVGREKMSDYDIIRVIRKGVTIWENGKSLTPQPINKMMTAIHNGVEYPIATHENMKILVDQVSELETKVMELQAKLNEILK